MNKFVLELNFKKNRIKIVDIIKHKRKSPKGNVKKKRIFGHIFLKL